MAPGLAEPGGMALEVSTWFPVGVAWVVETLSLLRQELESVISAEIQTSIFTAIMSGISFASCN